MNGMLLLLEISLSGNQHAYAQEDNLVLFLAWLMMRWLVFFPITPLVSLSWVEGQPSTPAQNVRLPQAIYSPQPIYRAESVNQSLASKGIVLVKIDPKTGVVTETRMLQSPRGANYLMALL